jgi:hypothetical protein
MQLQVHHQTQCYSEYNIPPAGSIGAGSLLHSRTPSWNGVFSTTLCHPAHKDDNSQVVRATSPRAHHSVSGFQRSRVSATPWNPQMDRCVLHDVVLTAVSECRTEGHEKSRNENLDQSVERTCRPERQPSISTANPESGTYKIGYTEAQN